MFIRCYPAKLTDAEWEKIRAVFADSTLLTAIDELRRCKNLPQRACDIFDATHQNCAHEFVNNALRINMLPFRMTRIGGWAWPHHNRSERRLAIVRWAVGKQLKLELAPPYAQAS